MTPETIALALQQLRSNFPVSDESSPQAGEAGPEPTAGELAEPSLACERLWELDANRLEANKDYRIRVRQGEVAYEPEAGSNETLFSYVDERVFSERDTFRTFAALLDNFDQKLGIAEIVLKKDKAEAWAFLSAALETKPMQYAHAWLAENGFAPRSVRAFGSLLYQMWFELYRRETRDDSSGFEHVFVGELRGGQVIGFHNWIQYYMQERKKSIEYKGYVLPISCEIHDKECEARLDMFKPDSESRVASIGFEWHFREKKQACATSIFPICHTPCFPHVSPPLRFQSDEQLGEYHHLLKTKTSMFIGSSPEFELALYTLCFLAGRDKTRMSIDGIPFDVRIFRYPSRFGDKVASAYPRPLDPSEWPPNADADASEATTVNVAEAAEEEDSEAADVGIPENALEIALEEAKQEETRAAEALEREREEARKGLEERLKERAKG